MDFFKTLWGDFMSVCGDRVQLGTNTVTTLNIIVWSIFIGFLLAIIISLYNKLVIGTAVRGIIEKKAFSESDAVTLTEIDCKKSLPGVVFALKINNTLKKIIRKAQDSDADNDSGNVKYYIPEDIVHKAETIYGKKGITAGNIVLAIVALLIVSVAAIYFVPDLITMLSNLVNGIPSGKSEIL